MKSQFPVSVKLAYTLVMAIAAAGSPVFAADTLGEAFTAGKFGFSFRWRLENVDQEPLPHDATAVPLRARINFTTSEYLGFTLKAEFDYVFDFGLDDYNAGAGNKPNPPGYPVIADPGGEDLNQLYAQFKTASGSLFRLGRQRIIYDNARFVGNVGWRQNEQTYDAFSFSHVLENGLNVQYSYIGNVNRIFGDDVPAGDHDHNTHLVNASFDLEGLGKLTGYYYGIDNEDAAGLSNKTFGLRFGGAKALEEVKIGYGAEYAAQSDYADNPVGYDADYWRFDLSAALENVTVYGGYESLGGDQAMPGQAFRTPLATLHAFNGWADKFLATPGAGLSDLFIGAKGSLGKWNWNVLYHDFSAQSGSGDYGSEIDASIARKFGAFGLLLKAASFDTDSSAYGDTTKLWLQVTADF